MRKIKKIDNKIINILKRRINKAVNPDKIILFGSYARGKANEASDIDIFVIKNISKDEMKTIKRKIRKEIRDVIIDYMIDIDIFVDSQERFEYRISEIKDQFYMDIKNQGKLIYAK